MADRPAEPGPPTGGVSGARWFPSPDRPERTAPPDPLGLGFPTPPRLPEPPAARRVAPGLGEGGLAERGRASREGAAWGGEPWST